MARVNQAGDDGVPQALLRFREALGGLGALGGPDRAPFKQDLYRWSVSSGSGVRELLTLLGPWIGEVKGAQLSVASRVLLVPSAPPRADKAWRAWAAGLFDGDGCSALLHHRTHVGYLVPELTITQSSNSGRPQVLNRFAEIVSAGAVFGPYPQNNGWSDVYRWRASARGDCKRVIEALWPYLGAVKRVQAKRVIDALAMQPDLQRGNPAFGYHKDRCVHGHAYATARVRPFIARSGGDEPRANAKCLVCLRLYAQKARDTKRSAADDDRRSLREPLYRYDYYYLLK